MDSHSVLLGMCLLLASSHHPDNKITHMSLKSVLSLSILQLAINLNPLLYYKHNQKTIRSKGTESSEFKVL